MSLSIASLNSGSNGNCYYIGNDAEAVLIDAGISCRETERRMNSLGLPMERVKAIFVSHEHSDHINGINVLSRKYNLPVYLTAPMAQHCRIQVEPHRVLLYKAFEPLRIGNLRITAFPKLHDACDPHSFTVADDFVTIGVFTDIGHPCKELIRHFKQCNAAFLEANYDDDMLRNGHYPIHLKNRIKGGKGHLSNYQALQVFTSCRSTSMSHLLLAHLSKENNCPKLVQNLFSQHAGKTHVSVASRYEASPVYHIRSSGIATVAAGPLIIPSVQRQQVQLSLF